MKYTVSHEWIELQEGIATIGITHYAQQELGNIVYVELPHLHAKVQAKDPVVVLESTKSAVDIYSPLSGEIVETNVSLKQSPEKVNLSAEKEGWLFKLKLSNPSEYDTL